MMVAEFETQLVRRNIEIDGRRTSFSLEAGVWGALIDVCRAEEVSVDEMCAKIVAANQDVSMASAIRVYTVEYLHKLGDA